MRIRILLSLVLFVSCFTNAVASNPIIPTLSDLNVCDSNSDGIAIFDLTASSSIVFVGLVNISSNYTEFEIQNLTYAPNPVNSTIDIKCNDGIEEICIYNYLGQMVLHQKALSPQVQVDISSLVSGNYFIKVTSEAKHSTFRVVKN